MTQPPAYEFEEDEAPKKERKAFIPGLEPVAPAGPPAGAPGGVAPGGAAPTAAKAPPLAPPPAASEAEDPDLKPGSRKDLWTCPHCQTRNKPDRSTCRECGKLPSDALEPAFYTKPVFKAAIAGAMVLVLLLWFVTRPNLSFKAPGAPTVDRSVRKGSALGGVRDLVGKTFKPHGRLSVSGRICATRPLAEVEGVTTVVLLLGSATSDEQLEGAKVGFNNLLITPPPGAVILNLITKDKIDGTKGAWLSVLGDYGDLVEEGRALSDTVEGDIVAVEQLQQ